MEFQTWARNQGIAASTARRYARYVADFPADATTADVRRWWRALVRRRLSPATVNVQVAALRTWFRYLVVTGHRTTDPTVGLHMQPTHRRRPVPLNRTELDQLFRTVRDSQDRLILELLYGSGLRRAEAATLTLANVVAPDRLRVGTRHTILTQAAYQALQACVRARTGKAIEAARPSLPLFVTDLGTPVADLRDPGHWVWRRCKAYGINPGRLRHTFAADLLAEGADPYTTTRLMGRTSMVTMQARGTVDPAALDHARRVHVRSG